VGRESAHSLHRKHGEARYLVAEIELSDGIALVNYLVSKQCNVKVLSITVVDLTAAASLLHSAATHHHHHPKLSPSHSIDIPPQSSTHKKRPINPVRPQNEAQTQCRITPPPPTTSPSRTGPQTRTGTTTTQIPDMPQCRRTATAQPHLTAAAPTLNTHPPRTILTSAPSNLPQRQRQRQRHSLPRSPF
jgi:hypothetical protein